MIADPTDLNIIACTSGNGADTVFSTGSVTFSDLYITVDNGLSETLNTTYNTTIFLMFLCAHSFTYKDTLNYGPYLESINGLAGNPSEHTYWEFLVKFTNGTIIRPNVGKFEFCHVFRTWK
uniref:DUF4430 domain-containing protein n=1 Tax=Scleropages formosus TaxID=113540 RepID=A0A8C9T0K0_SCLFO